MKVLALISSRLLYGGLVLVLVSSLISTLIYLGQVDPARLSFGQRADVQTVEAKRAAMGLDDPLSHQLARYLGDLSPLQRVNNSRLLSLPYQYTNVYVGNSHTWVIKKPYLRESFQYGTSVADLIREAFPLTAILAVSAFGIALFLGLLMGIIAAVRYNEPIDRLIIALSSIGYSLPSYVVAMVVAILFAYYLQAWTGLNIQGSIFELDEMGDEIIVWKNLLLPALALGVRPLAIITQITRSSVLDVLSAPYIRTARAKGLAFAKVMKKHVLRNALNPIGTAVSGWFASLLAGAFFVETVFNFKGLGSLTVDALLNYDVPLILGCILFTSVLFVVINLCTDLFYILVDPRQKL